MHCYWIGNGVKMWKQHFEQFIQKYTFKKDLDLIPESNCTTYLQNSNTEKEANVENAKQITSEKINKDFIETNCAQNRCNNLENIFYKKNKQLTVILVNYNNEKYLEKRLNSIYLQTTLPNQVIIIDDCSSDNSMSIIKNYINKYSGKVDSTIILNEKNTGSGYYNWLKGIELAKNDYIWIAESDDYCDKNFIEVLMKEFDDDEVFISYANSIFVSELDKPIWKMEYYLNEKFKHNFKQYTNYLVDGIFSYKNIIPNASSCIFKKPKISSIFYDFLNKYNIRLVFDWLFYILISTDKKISYSTLTNNYYLIRNNNTSSTIQKNPDIYFYEHKFVFNFLIKHFDINWENCKIAYNNLSLNHPNKSLLNKYFKMDYRILIFIDSFTVGGGEIFPIHLANQMFKENYNIFVMVYKKTEIEQIKKLLYPYIKILYYDESNINFILNKYSITHINTHHQSCDSAILHINIGSIKHIITNHGMYNIINKNTNYLIDLIYRKQPTIVNINIKNALIFENCSKKCIIPITVGDYRYTKIERADFDFKDDDFVITLASRCIPEKGWEEMISIFNNICKKYKNVKLFLVGDYNNKYGLKLFKKNINKNIYFMGFKDCVRQFFDISDIGILPTYYICESNPIVLIECLLSGKPFISSDIGDIKNMLFGLNDYAGSAIHLDKNNRIDIDIFTHEIIRYINDKQFYISKKNEVLNAVQKFNIELTLIDYINAYNL
jgi:glycosyltransferase involved in cell wall biosynthesis